MLDTEVTEALADLPDVELESPVLDISVVELPPDCEGEFVGNTEADVVVNAGKLPVLFGIGSPSAVPKSRWRKKRNNTRKYLMERIVRTSQWASPRNSSNVQNDKSRMID